MTIRWTSIELACVAQTPLHFGSGSTSSSTDAPLARDANGALCLFGTQTAGALRAVAELIEAGRSFADDTTTTPQTNALFGAHLGDTGTSSSALWVFDAPVMLPEGRQTSVRDRVAIDRIRGTAAERRKYDLEEAPIGTTFVVRLKLEARQADADSRALLAAIIRHIHAYGFSVGGRASQSTGHCRVTGVLWQDIDLSQPSQLLAFLRNGQPNGCMRLEKQAALDHLNDLAGTPPLVPPSTLDVEMTWRGAEGECPTPILVSDPLASLLSGYDFAPLGHDGSDEAMTRLELPGSAIRGVWRSRAEFILRTLAHAVRPGDEGVVCCDPLSDRSCYQQKREQEQRCLGCILFGNESHAAHAVLIVDPVEAADARLQPFDYVALDRFTGGARDGAKFDALTVVGSGTSLRQPLRWQVRDAEKWMLGLLALVAKDATRGAITVGAGANKGYGEFSVELVASGGSWREAPDLHVDLDRAVTALHESVADRMAEPQQAEAAP